MRREAITLVFAMGIGSVLAAVFDERVRQQAEQEASTPVQGQLDPKEPAQHRDLEQKK